jgi:hypothetical protein
VCGQGDVKQLIKRQLTTKTTSKHQQITMAHAATETDDNQHHLLACFVSCSPSSTLDVTSSHI